MSPLHSFITLLWLFVCSLAMPLTDDDDDDACESPSVQHLVVSSPSAVHVPDSPPASILNPYQPIPHPSPFQYPHATLPVSNRSNTPAILAAVFTVVIALIAFIFTARYVARRSHITVDPFKDPPTALWSRSSTTSKKRLSDESWVSPTLPSLGSPGSPLSLNLELRRYAYTQRKLVPITSPVCTPTIAEFGRGLEFAGGDSGSAILVPPVRVPSPVYISPFSPPLSFASSSSLSPTPSTEQLSSPSPNMARFSRLLSSNFRDSHVVTSPTRPSTAHLIQTARSYAHAYRPFSAATTSLYTPPTALARLSGTRSRISFYSGPTADEHAGRGRVRDTLSTMTTMDTVCTVPHLHNAISEVQPSISPFADPETADGDGTEQFTASVRGLGTSLGLKVRLSDASEHAHYRLRERERERERERKRERERTERPSTDTETSEATATSVETGYSVHRRSRSFEMDEARKEFKLRDSESVLREIGW